MAFNQEIYDLRQLILNRLTYEESIFGFQNAWGTNDPDAPIIDQCNGDGRTINISWSKQFSLIGLNYYKLQVSSDEIDWYSLGFNGEWGDILYNEYDPNNLGFTKVYSNNIAHTRIPHNDGAVRILYYRVAAVTKNGIQSNWSNTAQGNTFFIEPCDLRPGSLFNSFEYNSNGGIIISGDAYEQGPNTYVGGGSITISGVASYAYAGIGIFNETSTTWPQTTKIDDTHFLVAYEDNTNKGYVKIGTISDGKATYSSATEYANKTYYLDISMLSTTQFVITYSDDDNSKYGTAKIGTISGSTITFGSSYVYNSSTSSYVYCTVLDSTHIVVAYSDTSNSNYGTAKIGTISGSTITFGSAYVFESSSISTVGHLDIDSLDSTHFVISYRGSDTHGKAIIGTTSGSTISYGSSCTFNSSDTLYPLVESLDSTHIIVLYSDGGNSSITTSMVGTISGTTISYGSKYTLNGYYNPLIYSIDSLDSTHFVVAYRDDNNTDIGTYIEGTVSGSTISYGSSSEINGEEVSRFSVSSLDSSTVVIAYRDDSNSFYGTALVFNI